VITIYSFLFNIYKIV